MMNNSVVSGSISTINSIVLLELGTLMLQNMEY